VSPAISNKAKERQGGNLGSLAFLRYSFDKLFHVISASFTKNFNSSSCDFDPNFTNYACDVVLKIFNSS